MAWTHPKTAVAGQPVTAVDFNQGVRDNLAAMGIEAIGPSDKAWMTSWGPNAVSVGLFQLSRVNSPVTFTSSVDTYTNSGSGQITACNTGALVHLNWEASRATDTGGRATLWMRVLVTDANANTTETEIHARLFTEQAGYGQYAYSWCDFIPVGVEGSATFQMQYKLDYTFGVTTGDVVLENTSLVVFPF